MINISESPELGAQELKKIRTIVRWLLLTIAKTIFQRTLLIGLMKEFSIDSFKVVLLLFASV